MPRRATILPMLASRLRTLSIFAGGCLSGAVLIVVWQVDTKPSSVQKSALRASAHPVEPSADADPAPTEGARGSGATNAHDGAESGETATAEHTPPATKGVEDVAEAPTAESGRAVSDVLAHLEAAYRQQLGAAPASATQASPGALAAATADPQAPAAAAPSAALGSASTVVAAAPVLAAPARVEAPAAVASATPTPAAAPVVVLAAPVVALPAVTAAPVATAVPAGMAPAVAAPLAAAPAVALPGASSPLAGTQAAAVPPTTNVSIGSIHQGDTYHVQQVAITQYVPMFAPYPYGGYGYGGYGYPSSGHAPYSRQPKSVPYPSTLTNPEPWGFPNPSALWTVR